MLPSIKNSIIFGAIIVVLVLVYFFVFKKDPNDGVLIQNTTTPNVLNTTPSSDQDFLPLLLSVKNIKLDNSIFADKAFMSLVDSSIVLIPDGDEGRPNPFAPLNSVLNQSAKKITTESN